jgi:glucose dehydrogenase
MLTTGGNLVVYTTQAGTFTVADAKTGAKLYSVDTGIAAKSGPITFTHKGKQMIVQALGGQAQFGRDDILKLEFGHAIVAFTR